MTGRILPSTIACNPLSATGLSLKEMAMRDFTLTIKCLSFWKKNLTRPAIPVAA